jgi:sigma-E factor negative regulatory protein RseC
MKKEQQGIVIEVKDKIAIVKLTQHGDCENCGSCAGSNASLIEMNNKIGAKKGDKVTFEPVENGMLKATFIVFWFPLISIFIGSQFGAWMSTQLNNSTNMYQVLGGIIALIISLAIIVFYEKKVKSNLNRLPIIIDAISFV